VDAGDRGATPQGQSKLPVLCTPLRFGL
jgi:hypothetical protein